MLTVEPLASIENGVVVPDPFGRWIASYHWSDDWYCWRVIDSDPLVAASVALWFANRQREAVARVEAQRQEAAAARKPRRKKEASDAPAPAQP